jgi:hypothetical protein
LEEKTNAAADKILDEGLLGGHIREVVDDSITEAETAPVEEKEVKNNGNPSISGAIE